LLRLIVFREARPIIHTTQTKQTNYLKIVFILSIPYVAMSLSHNGFLGLLPFIHEEFVLTRTQVGYYSTFFFLSSTVLAVFSGNIVDRVGPKIGLIFGVTCMGLISFCYGLSPTYTILLMLAPIAGVGQSIINPSVNKGIIIGIPPGKHAVSIGISQSGLGVGGLAGASLLPFFGEIFGWRLTIQVAGVFVLLAGFLVYKFYHQHSENNEIEGDQGDREKQLPSFKENLIYFFRMKQILFMCFLGVILAGSSVGAVLSHFAVYLSSDLNMSRAAAGVGLGIFQIGGIIGRPIWGWISDRFLLGNKEKAISLLGLSAGFIYLIPGIFFNSPQLNLVAVYLFSFFLGFSVFGWGGLYFAAIAEFAGLERAGSAIGFSLLFNRIGILIAPPIFGLIADLRGNYNYSWLFFGAVIIFISGLYYLSSLKVEQHN